MEQKVTKETNWLYKEISENERIFSRLISRSEDSIPWIECTNKEKLAWEEAHKPEEPEEAEEAEEV
jgi:hypothetical protein